MKDSPPLSMPILDHSGRCHLPPLSFRLLAFLGLIPVLAWSESLVIPLWPEGVPGLQANAGAEVESDGRFTNVHHPTLTVYAPETAQSTGVAVVLCPGGGYVRVGDGRGDARWLNSLGITAFVLKYRLSDYGHPAPLQDVLRAVRLVRSRAAEFGVRPDRIGIMGGSAGGHLAACAATLWDLPLGKTGHALDAMSARPDFAALIYPVVTMEDPFVHQGSRRALLGRQPDPAWVQLLSLERQVRTNSPPCFIVATMADRSVPVENSLRLYQALRDAGVPAELHAYSTGAHGNTRDPQYGPTARWPQRCEEWLRFKRWLPPEQHDFARWEKDIAAMEAADQTNPPPRNGVLFAGSSMIRLWKTLAEDFPGVPVVNRGFGGSEIVDSTHFADRLIFPHAPRQIFLRAGGNDLHNSKTPEQVLAEFRDFVATVRARLADTEIVFIGWNVTPARWPAARRERELNRLVAAFAQTHPGVAYLETADITLDPQGHLRPAVFDEDQLHFNAEGYRLLAEKVRSRIRK